MTTISPENVVWALQQAGWPQDKWALMCAISGGESSWNTTARNSYTDPSTGKVYDVLGLWQISTIHSGLFSNLDWTNPVHNAIMALKVYDEQGLSAWEAYTNNSYLTYYGRSAVAAARPNPMPGVTGNPGAIGNPAVNYASAGTGNSSSSAGLNSAGLAFSSKWTWIRFGEIGFGGIMLTLGLFMLLRGDSTGQALKNGLANFGTGKLDALTTVVKSKG